MTAKISENNFDLIRLFAASQVAILHVISYVSPHLNSSPLATLLDIFPGVPIFFFISGILISRSFEKTGDIADYARNRILRIYPALHICVIFNLIIVALTGYFTLNNVSFFEIFTLYLAKATIFQFYNPDFMRHFGDGVLNGSLWTICVELQFYCLMPIVYRLIISPDKKRTNFGLGTIIVISILINRLLYRIAPDYATTNMWKLLRVSFAPWIYMFLFGVAIQINFGFFSKLLKKYSMGIALPVYIAFALATRNAGFSFINSVSPIIFFPLVFTVLATAYSAPSLAKRLLCGNDISYGIYIYHVPVMNMFLYYGLTGAGWHATAILGLSLVLALCSWFLLERPSLQAKRKASHPIATPTGQVNHGA